MFGSGDGAVGNGQGEVAALVGIGVIAHVLEFFGPLDVAEAQIEQVIGLGGEVVVALGEEDRAFEEPCPEFCFAADG
jgi:hypothetical protein